MNYNLSLVTAPATEPITADEAFGYINSTTSGTPDTAFMTGLIKAAREYCEEFQNRAYITQTWEMSMQGFPCAHNNRLDDYRTSSTIEIPKGSLQSVVSIKYTDSVGIVHTLPLTDYVVTIRGIVGKISPPCSGIWPTAELSPLDPVVIQFICGYGNAANVPFRVKQAMFMLISYWYDNRTAAGNATKELEFSVKSLLSQDRIAVV